MSKADEKKLPYGCQWIDDADLAALATAARADFLTQGPAVAAFERQLAESCGAPFAVACSSGTAALHLAALAAGVGPGDVTITTPLTFVASANATVYCGGTPRFADIDRKTRNLSTEKLAAALDAKDSVGRVKLVVPVHYAGQPADMPAIERLARKAGALVVEDACHALGASYRDPSDEKLWHTVGSCAHSDMTCMSFHPVKHITTGEGGAITTRSEALYKKLLLLRTHGITKSATDIAHSDGPWYYEMQALGFNYRITDLQCALGSTQLARLPGFVARRREIARRYDAGLAGIPGLTLPLDGESTRSSYHLYPIWIDEERIEKGRRRVFEELTARGLGVQVHYIPVHLQPYYRQHHGTAPGQFPEAERFYRGEISIPMYPKMDDADVARVIATVADVLRG